MARLKGTVGRPCGPTSEHPHVKRSCLKDRASSQIPDAGSRPAVEGTRSTLRCSARRGPVREREAGHRQAAVEVRCRAADCSAPRARGRWRAAACSQSRGLALGCRATWLAQGVIRTVLRTQGWASEPEIDQGARAGGLALSRTLGCRCPNDSLMAPASVRRTVLITP
jgi:hypothetical protein